MSTPDTTVALAALREFSKKMKVFDRDSKIDLRYTYSNAVRRYAPYITDSFSIPTSTLFE